MLQRFVLTCLKCGAEEEISANLSDPSELHCKSCDEDIDLEDVRTSIRDWGKYIKAYDELIAFEKQRDNETVKEKYPDDDGGELQSDETT